MSIAVIAPTKFDFQDLVCVELLLRFDTVSGVVMIVEPGKSEDACLTLPLSCTEQLTIDVQVKGAGGTVHMAAIADMLAHCPPREPGNTLLERLIASPDRIALLVVSGRCDDAASTFVSPFEWNGTRPQSGRTTLATASDLLAAFGTLADTRQSNLSARRKAHRDQLVATLVPGAIRPALDRVIVLERVNSGDLEIACERHLRARYQIPIDQSPDIINRLRSAIKRAKTEKKDAAPLLREVLMRSAPQSLRPPGYVPRGLESRLVEELSKQRCLLLSGPPRCGKSDVALCVAAEFQQLGYQVRQGADVEAAERFLLDPTPGDRVFVLDDPLGGSHANPDGGRIVERLGLLIARLSLNRKIIVAQSQDLLLATMMRSQLDACAIAGQAWENLGSYPADFLGRLWQGWTAAAGVPSPLRERMTDALAKGDIVLEPGCLQYLAHSGSALSANMELEEAARLARQPARTLGLALAADHRMATTLKALAIGSAPLEPIVAREFAFSIDKTIEDVPGKVQSQFPTVSFGGDQIRNVDPEYQTEPRIDLEAELNLENLERRRLISIAAHRALAFTHPFYRAAAEETLYGSTARSADETLQIAKRSLFCLSSTTSRATARNFHWLYGALANRPEDQQRLLDLAAEGLSSIFPATRDLCLKFLLRNLADLKKPLREQIPHWMRIVARSSVDDVHWRDGEAVFPSGDAISGADLMLWSLRRVTKADVAGELHILDSNIETYLSPERAVSALTYFRRKPAALSARVMGRLLSYHEAMIRAEAVRPWLSRKRTNDAELLARIFDDESPTVMLAVLKGACEGWTRFSDKRKSLILGGLIGAAKRPLAALVLVDRLILFNRIDVYGETPPWPVLGALLPVVLSKLPPEAEIADERLFDVMVAAKDELPIEQLLAILDSWLGWIERVLASGRQPDEFALGLADVLLRVTKTKPELRRDMVSRLFALPGTGTLMTVLRDFVDEWEALDLAERSSIIAIVTRDRKDRRWIQALVLTRKKVPPELQQAILGAPDGLSIGSSAVIGTFSPELLEASVAVYCGRPGQLWSLGTHHTRGMLWGGVIRELCFQPEHPQFETAFSDLAVRGDGKTLAEAITSVREDFLDRYFECLLGRRTYEAGNYLSEAWQALFSRADENTRERWLDRIVDLASLVLDHLRDVKSWLKGPVEQEALVKKLYRDFVPLALLVKVKDLRSEHQEALKQTTAASLKAWIAKHPPSIYGTYDQIRDHCEALGIDDIELDEMLEAGRMRVLDMQDRKEREDHDLPDWIDP